MSAKPGNRDNDARRRAISLFRKHRGMLRMAQAIDAGIHRNTLYALVQDGTVERIARGLYRLDDALPLGNPDLVTVSQKVPNGVVCLISALAYHELTTQIPHEVYVAISRNSEPPRLGYPPIRVFRFSGKAFSDGIESPRLDGIRVRIYNREKTLADCFKFRNKIGMDVVLEALKLYKARKKFNHERIVKYARICRVEKVMRPYLEVNV